ncbi:MAG: hypothetical protein C0518_05380 [Opitutus sp.]|nr:hypothetical protein [Opitutus sp.]
MTPRQTAKYWSEFQRVRDVLIARGIDKQQIESKRHELHKKALGHHKSSKDFTNADLDKVLAAFLAITEPGNLRAQLRQLEQPAARKADVWTQIEAILSELRIGTDAATGGGDLARRRLAYVEGIVARVIRGKRTWAELTDKEAAVLLGIMQKRVLSQRRASGKLEAAQAAVDDGDPWL